MGWWTSVLSDWPYTILQRDKMSQFMEKQAIKHIRKKCNKGMNVTGEAGLITGRLNVTLWYLAPIFGSKCQFLGCTYSPSAFGPSVTGTKCHSGRNVQWTFRLGRNVQWMFRWWTFCPGTRVMSLCFIWYRELSIICRANIDPELKISTQGSLSVVNGKESHNSLY